MAGGHARTQIEKDGFRFLVGEQDAVLMKYIGKEESVIIPQTVNGKPVLHIQQFAFERPSHILKKIVIPEGVLSIGSQAFQN